MYRLVSLRAPRLCWAGTGSLAVVAVLMVATGLQAPTPASQPRPAAHASIARPAEPALNLQPRGTVVAIAQPDQVAPSAAPAPAAPSVAPAIAPTTAPAAPIAPPPSTPAPSPTVLRNRLVGPGGLDTAVGAYSDCTGEVPLPAGSAAIDSCVTDRQFFVGHNPGVFTPLTQTPVGAVITWYDGDGTAHALRVIQTRTWQHVGLPTLAPGATAQFQTCLVPDGSVDMILDATPA